MRQKLGPQVLDKFITYYVVVMCGCRHQTAWTRGTSHFSDRRFSGGASYRLD